MKPRPKESTGRGQERARSRASRGPALLLAGLLVQGAVAPLAAQSPEEPLRTHRHLAVGNIGFLHTWDPAIHGGYLYQFSIRKSGVSVDDLGITTVTPPRWYAHTLVAAGWAADADGLGDGGFASTGQLGLLYRFDGPMSISRAGLAMQGSLGPTGWGPVARVGFFYGNAALSAGWMFFDDRGDGVVVGIDLLRCILQDLGLVSRCVIP